ncbi:NAD(P)-dependent alcohol dehydrogenase [Frankia sp. R82]|uniref:NAD(P)-dependent alcohol dehydrogenase n=1 Tax=Frankia sp. R82 TaxID=2950553 RepID=UPI0020436D8D|nr:NAD(P)-dependent alcohol dehydrogenase [Frankia sp. R82]MCM3884753.1 NAD(P)-dependent alcohol dehydrogenase [Frankia sp. R82]
MTSARCAVLRGTDQEFQIETVSLEAPRAGEALIRIAGAGLCHTDLLPRTGMFGPSFLPAILGHEGSGVIEEVGPGVSDLRPGDHVVLTFDTCGECDNCRSGQPAVCVRFEALNVGARRPDGSGCATDADGAALLSRWFAQSSFGEYSIATTRNMVKVDPDAPLHLLGPLGCGLQTGAGAVLNQLRLAPDQSIVIFGAGAVGLAALLAARLSGAREIVAVDLNSSRRELALELGATRAVDGADPDLAKVITGGGAGFDFSIDTTGVGSAMAAAVAVLRRPGSCILVGSGRDNLDVHPAALIGKWVTFGYEGGSVPHLFIPRLIRLWQAGLFPFDKIIKTFPLADINRAEAESRAGGAVKPVLLMD